MHLTRMRFGGVPPLTEQVEFSFDERVNVFVGANATGKSRLLSAIDEYFNKKEDTRDWHEGIIGGIARFEPYPSDLLSLTLCQEEALLSEWMKGKNALCTDREWAEARFNSSDNPPPPVIYLGPTRISLPVISELGESDSYGSTVEEVLSGPFSGGRLKAAIDLLYAKARKMFEQERVQDTPTEDRKAWNFWSIGKVTHICAKSICEEVISSDRALNYPTGLDAGFIGDEPMADLDSVNINRMLGVDTTDTPTFDHIRPADRPRGWEGPDSGRIFVGDLSSGSQSTLLWILWLAFKMLNHYDFANGWNEKPAVLLIDEIENHLHPTWQRRVIPSLLSHFPGLQILATSHSPFAVAGLRSGQVHMLKRDSDGLVTASTNERDIIGWTTDEILRTFMGVDEPTDQLTVDRLNRLRELRGKEELSDTEAEEMSDLRRKVNEDFVSSSTPLEAQRERYGDMMLAFLQARQSELSQDGS
ncbi:MAG: AAA family ATPase [Dehalococcoidia bacterium]|nr:AAA family ATPase [Dehalococcoidia bacterium]